MTIAGATTLEVDHSFASEFPELGIEWEASPAPEPDLLVLNAPLAADLGIDPSDLKSPGGVAVLAGNATPPSARPIAMAYAGHQFGGFSPRLGDGRALLIGEATTSDGQLLDIHLKGSGRTPFARGGDGKAAVGPMLREYLMAEAMHALHIPTTRALAVVSTGEQIAREVMVPGAVLTRVAASHIRVGTFEYAARLEDTDVLRRLADYAIDRHHPSAVDAGDGRYLALLGSVAEAQASLIARWMLVGFIHGVMNTDNVTISGETIDYGPCAFMDRYDPATVYSSIDHMGRYSYGNQPGIGQWNLIRFAETLLPLIDSDTDVAVDAAKEVLTAFPDRFAHYWAEGMRAKLGLTQEMATDKVLVEDLLELLHGERLDFTTTFRTLAAASLRGDGSNPRVLSEWIGQWRRRLDAEGRDPVTVAQEMDETNPIYIPRNHLVEVALDAATEGDIKPFDELLGSVTHPFTEREGYERFAAPAPEAFDVNYQTFCGT